MTDRRPPQTRLLTVGEVAAAAHVSVRTLHHYDEIGLLRPAERSAAGYRLYGPAELERLHQVLLFRELGLSLEEVGELLERDAGERRAALTAHRTALERRLGRTRAVIRAVDRAIGALEEERAMNTTELFAGFEDFDHARHAGEAERRWGDTDAYEEAARRTQGYDRRDRAAMKAELEGLMERLAQLLRSGAEATSEAAVELAEEHRRHIDRWFYPCPPAMHAALADMYEADPRFAESFERYAEGLAGFVVEAIRANAGR